VKVRRVVTGQTADGKSVFVGDEEVEPIMLALTPGSEFHRLWGADGTVELPTDGNEPSYHAYFPPAGGFRFAFFTLPTAETAQLPDDLDLTAALQEMEEKLPGLAGHMEADNPGMHTTHTVDVEVVLSGEVVLELDDGAEKTMKAGDVIVQNGTRHRWRNDGSEAAVLAVAIIGATRG
jgi:mannose-6-phosphate isomerase-like protein (cupin superfamily)